MQAQPQKQLTSEQLKKLQEEFEKLPEEKKKEILEKQCLFCQIVRGTIEAIKLYEDKDFLAILDIRPASKGHTLVLPKRHAQFLFQLPIELRDKLFDLATRLSTFLINATKATGFNLFLANGLTAGQRVPHLALNIIPRYENDSLSFEWKGEEADKKELEKLSVKVREKLASEKFETKKEPEKSKKQKAEEDEELKKLVKRLERIP